MSDFTPRANLRLPGGGSTGTILPDEQVDIDVLNDNFRKIDALLGARNIPSASSYSGSMDGDLVYARDTEFLHMFSTTAGGLVTPRLPGSKMFSGTRAQRTAFTSVRDGDLWRDTDNIGIIWAYKAGSPGTWVYAGNECVGTMAAITQTHTDGVATVGMRAYATDTSRYYVYRANGWVMAPGQILASVTAAVSSGAAGTLIAGARVDNLSAGQKLLVVVGGVGAYNSVAGTGSATATYTTNGSAPTAGSASFGVSRAYLPSGANVATIPGYTKDFTMPADGDFRIGVFVGSNMISYGADGQALTIVSA